MADKKGSGGSGGSGNKTGGQWPREKADRQGPLTGGGNKRSDKPSPGTGDMGPNKNNKKSE